ncbi:MAG TPA: autotransporter-associated beta strand repeat-containing protein [Kiritimatiellia bacterium]|nr:autotransporter-associated beta strand repeat-containing protein [Kiritimatiellia bacterium]HRU70285.1 autotransporter-associated beta strand repeat-containing protein [Kiritimatiellia bacterium]
MKPIHPAMFYTLAAAAALFGASRVAAVEHFMKANDAMDTSSFNTGVQWDDGQAPKAGDTYVANHQMRTPGSGSSHTFAGDLLTVTSSILWKGPDGASVTVPAMVLRGRVSHGLGNCTGKIYGNITIPADAAASFSTGVEEDLRIFHVYAPLTGSGSLLLFIPRRSSHMKEIRLAADNTAFTGPITLVGKGKLTLSNENNLGGNPPEWNPRQLTLNGSVLRIQSDLTLDDTNRGIWLSNMTVTASDVYPGGRFEIANNITSTIACVIGGEGPFEKIDLGTLILTATNTYTGPTIVSAGTLLINKQRHQRQPLAVCSSQRGVRRHWNRVRYRNLRVRCRTRARRQRVRNPDACA